MDPTSLVAVAEQAYRNHSWAAAQVLYRQIAERDPLLSVQLSLPLVLAHCAVELAQAEPPDAPIPEHTAVAVDRASLVKRLEHLRRRGAELCANRDFDRASRLFRLMAEYDWSIRYTYKTSITDARSECCDLLADAPIDKDPPFLDDLRLSDADVARIARRFHGARVLQVVPTTMPRASLWSGTAERFGLVPRQFDAWTPTAADAPERYAESLDEALRAFRPAVVMFWNLYESGPTTLPEVGEAVTQVLEAGRRTLGFRVVKPLPDAWFVSGGLYRGLGTAVDLVMHHQPEALADASSTEAAATLCFPPPHILPEPTVAYDTIPRAWFSGGVDVASPSRLVWWTELGRCDLPIDFHFRQQSAAPLAAAGVSDVEFANRFRSYRITLNSTRRANGMPILTGRTIETALCGGFLLEEDSIAAAYFFKRGLHYMPFHTLGDVETMLPALLDDHERRICASRAAQPWARKYFTGDYFWAGLMSRSDPDHRGA